jgi:hypothetical protein
MAPGIPRHLVPICTEIPKIMGKIESEENSPFFKHGMKIRKKGNV